MSNNDIYQPEWWSHKAIEFLEYAVQAEARKNESATDLLLRTAILCEARKNGDVATVEECTTLALPVS